MLESEAKVGANLLLASPSCWIEHFACAFCTSCQITKLINGPTVIPRRQSTKAGFNPGRLHIHLS
uniref:Copper chaperone for superoxide dismutase n=1 Tax=Rhizophora mucronata TaxID=61149 RepID=A0A2P2KAQ0_RHIMU